MDKSQHSEVIILSPEKQCTFENKWYYDIAQPSHFWIEGRFKVFMNLINQAGMDIHKPLQGMEIGCGNSVVRSELEARSSWIVDGSDLDLHGLQLAKNSKGKIYLYDILEQNPMFKERYDFLILFDVIEHIPDVARFMDACLFHLKKGGIMFINVPALQRLFSVYDQVQGHQLRYVKSTLRRVLPESKFNIIDMRYWGLSLVPLVFIRKVMSHSSQNPETVIRKGFQPPRQGINSILRKILLFEMRILPTPVMGTSLFAVVQKI